MLFSLFIFFYSLNSVFFILISIISNLFLIYLPIIADLFLVKLIYIINFFIFIYWLIMKLYYVFTLFLIFNYPIVLIFLKMMIIVISISQFFVNIFYSHFLNFSIVSALHLYQFAIFIWFNCLIYYWDCWCWHLVFILLALIIVNVIEVLIILSFYFIRLFFIVCQVRIFHEYLNYNDQINSCFFVISYLIIIISPINP